MHVDRTPAPATPRVNLAELAEVRQHHLPCTLVRLSCLKQLRRRTDEISREIPRLAEEAAFVLADETKRRANLKLPPLRRCLP